MFNILTLNKISEVGMSNFEEGKYLYGDNVSNPDAIIVRSASMHDMDIPQTLKAIARAGAGVNNIPVDECTEKGILVFNTPGANANAVKELVICALLLSSRRILPAISWCSTLKGQGSEVPKLVEKGKSDFAGPEIKGKTLGLIGLGAIGALVANAASDLGMKVIGYDPYLTDENVSLLNENVSICSDAETIFAKSDYISLHAPATESTKGMINDESFAKMKDGVRILNFARAELVNDDSLLKALDSGKCAAFVTDFPTDRQLNVDGIIAIPHLGASTPESEENCAYMAAMQIKDFLENGNIKNSINLPNLEMKKEGEGNRVCIISKENIEDAAVEALSGIRILAKATKSKKAFYTIIDVADVISDSQIAKIKELDGVLNLHII